MAAGTDGRRRKGTSLGTRIFFATALLVIFAVGLAVAVTFLMGSRVGADAARKMLERAGAVQETFQEDRFEQLRLTAYLVASDPNFSAYVRETIESGDVPSLLDQLDERREGLGFDFALVLDPDGAVVARTDRPGATGGDFSGEAIYRQAFDGYDAGGIWAQGDALYYAEAVPITLAGLLEGFLIVAYAIDDQAALALREVNNTEVAFLLEGDGGPQVVAKTLSPAAADELAAFLAAGAGGEDQEQLVLQGQKWLTNARPLTDVAGEDVGTVIHLAPLDVGLEPFRRIGRTLLAVGALAMILALAISYLLPRQILQPVNQLAAAAGAAAEGDYDQEIKTDRADEVGQLAAAFSTLLSELREKRDMEIYVSELARTLPEPESASLEATPVEQRELTLVGVELRNYVKPPGFTPRTPHETLDALTRDLRRISRAIRAQDGRVEDVLGHRLVASFEGPRQSDHALTAAADVLGHARSSSHEIAVAMVSGSAVSGTTTWDNRPHYSLTGEPVEHLEGLLRVAQSGSLLLSSAVREQLRPTFEHSHVALQQHRSTVSAVPLYSLSGEAAARFAAPELAATREAAGTELMTTPVTATVGPTPQTLSGIGPGAVLGDRFEILSELGAGGMGVVYKARDRNLAELVALKMLKQEMFGDSARLERLKEELKLARKITHPNVLRTFDYGEADGYPFISMEFVRGVTLRQLLDRSGRLPLSAGLRTARQLCRGLGAAHAQGVLHRDIKPENLIIEPTGNVKLMDFGIARPTHRAGPAQTQPGMLMGTPFYLAPEQLEGREADARTDLYGVGVVVYEIFTGELPYPASASLAEALTRKLKEPPAPPRQHWPNMPDALERMILRCIERDPDRRYQSTDDLLRDLEVLRA